MQHAEHDERGVILVLLALMTTLLALLVGFALDTGNLYSARLAAQTAADAASLSGATTIAGRDAAATSLADSITSAGVVAQQIAIANLQLKSAFDTTSPRFSVTPSSQTFGDRVEFSVQVRSPVTLYILSHIPGYEQSGEVQVTATTRVKNATLAMILDTSRSMKCPKSDTGTTCACMDAGTCGTDGLPTKLDALKVAAKDLLTMFDESRDRVSLTVFGHVAEMLVPLNTASTFNRSVMDNKIDLLTAAGATNLSDGLLRSYLDMKRLGLEDEAAYMVFSDGAISAARLLLADPKVGTNPVYDNATPFNQPHNPLGFSFSQFDYISYAALWNKPSDPNFQVSSPHSLAFTPPPEHVAFSVPENGHGPITCTWPERPRKMDSAELPPECFVLWSIPSPGNASETFKQLFNSPALYDPDGVAHFRKGDFWNGNAYQWARFDGEEGPNGMPLSNPQRGVYRKLYYDAAMILADFMRKKGGVLFGVGLGVPASFVLDPYQNPDFDHDLKTTFFKRLVVDACGVADPIDPPFPGTFPNYDELFLDNVKAGMFLSTTDADELKQLFRVIAKKVKLSLIK